MFQGKQNHDEYIVKKSLKKCSQGCDIKIKFLKKYVF